MGFKDLPGGKDNKNKQTNTEIAKEISPKLTDKNTQKPK